MLLHFLKESGSSALSTGSPNKSPSRPSRIVYDSARLRVPLQLSMSEQGVSSGERTKPSQARGIASIKNTHTDIVDHSAVDEDVLADSDDEEMKEKDLDWHLGRLTSRQSMLSQWSQTLSSTAAHYSSKNKKLTSNGLSQRIEKSRDPHVSTTGQNGQRHRTVDTVQSLHKSDGRESLRIVDGHRPGPVEDNCGSSSSSSSSSSSGSSGSGGAGGVTHDNTTSILSSSSTASSSSNNSNMKQSYVDQSNPAPSTPSNKSSSNTSISTPPNSQPQSYNQSREESRERDGGVNQRNNMNRGVTLSKTDQDQQAYLKQAFCGFLKAKEAVEMEHLGTTDN